MDCRGHGARSRARGGSAEPGADPALSAASAASAGCRAGPQRRRPPRGHTGLAGRVHTARPSAGRAPRTSLWVTKWRGAALSRRGVVESPRDAGRCGLCPPPPQTLALQLTPRGPCRSSRPAPSGSGCGYRSAASKFEIICLNKMCPALASPWALGHTPPWAQGRSPGRDGQRPPTQGGGGETQPPSGVYGRAVTADCRDGPASRPVSAPLQTAAPRHCGPRDTAGPPPPHPPTASAPRDTAGPPVSAPRVGARPRPRAREGLADGGSLGGSGWAGASGPCVSRGFAAPGPAPVKSWPPAGSKAPAVCSHALGWPAGPPPPVPCCCAHHRQFPGPGKCVLCSANRDVRLDVPEPAGRVLCQHRWQTKSP